MDVQPADQITLPAVQAALQRCLDRHPPGEPGQKLHADANLIAEVFAEMNYKHEQARGIASLSPAQREAVERWLSSTNTQRPTNGS